MIHPSVFFTLLDKHDVNFYTGVPDSLLKYFSNHIEQQDNKYSHIISANEGQAIGLASGYYLATGKIPVVYMQNSGIGNALNPLVSLCDNNVYSIPLLLIIGWRGEPEVNDEPQHIRQGLIMPELLSLLNIPHSCLGPDDTDPDEVLNTAFQSMNINHIPYAILIKKNTFSDNAQEKAISEKFQLSRESAIKLLLEKINNDDIIVSTTGKTSRELYALREEKVQGHEHDFLNVGAMGHASSVALGVALSKPNKTVYCLDGDGSLLMHLGAIAIAGNQKPNNLKHIIINNGSHESVGGQPTAAFEIDIPKLAEACGYQNVFQAACLNELESVITAFTDSRRLSLLEIKVDAGSREKLPRPGIPLVELKKAFMNSLS